MSLLQMSFSGTVMILAVLAVRAAALHRLPKRTFVLLWGLALLRLLVPVAVPSAYSIYTLLSPAAPRTALPGPVTAPVLPGAAALPAAPAAVAAAPAAGGHALPVWGMVWAAGALLCAGAFVAAWLGCRARFAAAVPLDTGFAAAWLARHPLRRRITVRSCAGIDAPLTCGLLRPVILLPAAALRLPPAQLRCILLHEHIHIRRWDGAAKLAAAAALCLHWFNPLVWVLYTLLNRDLELACDEQVIWELGHGARAAYAGTLIDMKERQSGLVPLYSHFSKNAIEERIVAIMKNTPKTRRRTALGLCVAGAVALLLGTTACSRAPAAPPVSEPPAGTASPAPQTTGDEQPAGEVRPAATELPFVVEGEAEPAPATLYAGAGWSLYIPDAGWTHTAPDTWTSDDNADVWFRIGALSAAEQDALAQRVDETGTETDAGMTVRHRLFTGPDGTVWDGAAHYPPEAAEGFGTRIDTILDTFACVADPLGETALAFTRAYLAADSRTVQDLLAAGYTGPEDLYSGTAVPADAVLDVLAGEQAAAAEPDGTRRDVSVRFVDPDAGDSYLYLTLQLVREEGAWKVAFYGLEK